MPDLNHLPPTATPQQITEALRADGYVIIDNLVPASHMDRVSEELAPYIESTAFGGDDFLGRRTKRTGSLIARSVAARELVAHPTVLAVAGDYLNHASKFQLHLTQVIAIGPGSPAQAIHRDELAWDFFPFPADYQVQCNTLWAMSDYTAEMGATRVVPGSHLLGPDEKFTEDDSLPAEMERGSVLLYNGKIYHGGGANRTSDKVREAINITYAVGWVRQEENQYLSTPLEVAQTLDDDLLKLMGYQMGCFAIGYVGDVADPMTVVRPDAQSFLSVDAMRDAAARQESANNLMNLISDTATVGGRG